MKKIKNRMSIHILIGLLWSPGIFAAWAPVDITDIRAFQDQINNFVMVNEFANPDNCVVRNTLVILRDDASNWKMVHTMLVTGMLTKQNMEIRTAGCTVDTGYPIIDGVRILNQ